ALVERAARCWAAALGVDMSLEGSALRLFGRADALGCWTHHGRRVERAALELLAAPDLGVRELAGSILTGGRSCGYRWKGETLAALGAGRGPRFDAALPDRVATLAAALRRERARSDSAAWGIRQAAHVVAVHGGVCQPHLELRRGDFRLYL